MGTISKRSGGVVRWLRGMSPVLGCSLASSLLVGTGCGSTDPLEALGREEAAIGGNWRAFVQTAKTLSGGIASDPATCDAHADSGGWAAFGRGTDNKIYMNFIQKVPFPSAPAESGWLKQADKTFGSKPACAALDGLYLSP